MLKNYESKLEAITINIKELTNNLKIANELIFKGLENCSEENFKEARSYIKNMQGRANNIDNEIIKVLALYSPEAKDLRRIVAYLKITNELTRASSNTRSFIKGFIEICKDIDENTIKEYILPLQSATIRALEIIDEMVEIEDCDEIQDKYNEVVIQESKTDNLYSIIEDNILNNNTDFAKINKILKVIRKAEKIADRAISVASLFLFVNLGGNIR